MAKKIISYMDQASRYMDLLCEDENTDRKNEFEKTEDGKVEITGPDGQKVTLSPEEIEEIEHKVLGMEPEEKGEEEVVTESADKKAKFVMDINLGNSAFEDVPVGDVVADTLDEISENVRDGAKEAKIKDVNGNVVGEWKLEL